MFTKHDIRRDSCQLYGKQARKGYHWYWHSFTGHNEATGEEKAFFVEFFLCNPALGKNEPVFGIPYQKEPSYLMVKAGCWGKDARQLDRFFGWKRISVDYKVPFKIEAEDCILTETMTKGSVYVNEEENKRHPEWMSESGSMSWNLTNRLQCRIRSRFSIPEAAAIRNVLACRRNENHLFRDGNL